MKTIRRLSSIFVAVFVGACTASSASKSDEPGITPTPIDLPALETPSDPNVEHGAVVVDPPYAPEQPALASAPPLVLQRLEPTELDDLDVPDAPSPAPTEHEWIEATAKATTNSACTAKVVREWLKITCAIGELYQSDPIASVRVLSGDATKISVSGYIPPSASDGYNGWKESYARAILPMRRGDRRVFELTFLQGGTRLDMPHGAVFTVSEIWLEGMKSPEISVTR